MSVLITDDADGNQPENVVWGLVGNDGIETNVKQLILNRFLQILLMARLKWT